MCLGASRGSRAKNAAALRGAQGEPEPRGHDGHLELFSPSWDDAAGRFSLAIHIGAPLKWMCQQASFASVFSGSNDRNNATANVEIIADHPARVASIGKVSLVSVIGGAFLLDLVQRVGCSRILLFDQNVAEFAKISALLNLMAQDPGDDPVETLERMILARSDTLLPRLPLSEVSYNLAPGSAWEFDEGTSHQLGAPEDAALVGGPLDRTTDTFSVLGQPFPAVEPQTLRGFRHADTLCAPGGRDPRRNVFLVFTRH